MKVSINWLNEFVDLSDIEVEQIAHELTMSGLEVEATEEVRPSFTNIKTVRIEKIDAHPNSDHLHLVTVNLGSEMKTVVCGAQNIKEGQVVPYASVGLERNMSYNCYSPAWGLGILNEFKISKKVAINLDVNYNLFMNRADGANGLLPGAKPYKSRSFKGLIANHDRNLNVEIGLTYNLGKTGWSKTPDVEAIKALSQGQIDALNAQLADANAENARLRNQIANHKCPTTTNAVEAKQAVKEIVSAPVSVFFNIGKSKIASKKDLQNVQAIADAAKANNAKIVVKGYADSKTGSANFNQSLSQKRAQAVADALVNMGVDRANIECEAEGGVNTLSPISFNRRATVELK